jgi:hypothetical protein
MVDEIERGVDLARDAVLTAVIHARRVAGVVSGAVEDVAQEVRDLVWDYKHIASPEPWPADNADSADSADSGHEVEVNDLSQSHRDEEGVAPGPDDSC